LLDNGSVSTVPRQRIDGVTDELFEMMAYIRVASKLLEKSSVQFTRVQSFGIRKRVQCSVVEC
jgi:hypothetical protein